jgi:hypothetical protein
VVADLLQNAVAESIGKKELSEIKVIFVSVRKICLSLDSSLSLSLSLDSSPPKPFAECVVHRESPS